MTLPTAEELLRSPLLKLERANHHINDLNGKIQSFLSENPVELVVDPPDDTGRIPSPRFEKQKPIPQEFSLIVGDAIHNIRTALDIALFPMAAPRTPKPERIQFPFAKDASDAASKSACKEGQIKFAGTKVVKEISRLKPNPTRNRSLYGIHAWT
jgi:hypothetical protein